MIYCYLATHGHPYAQECAFDPHDDYAAGMFGWLQAYPSEAAAADDAEQCECHYERVSRRRIERDYGRKLVVALRTSVNH